MGSTSYYGSTLLKAIIAQNFIPATGYSTGTSTAGQGTAGYYWTGSLYTQVTSSAYNINFQGYDQEWTANRAYGFAIRPVR